MKRPRDRKALEKNVLRVFERSSRTISPSPEAWHRSGDLLSEMANQEGLEIARVPQGVRERHPARAVMPRVGLRARDGERSRLFSHPPVHLIRVHEALAGLRPQTRESGLVPSREARHDGPRRGDCQTGRMADAAKPEPARPRGDAVPHPEPPLRRPVRPASVPRTIRIRIDSDRHGQRRPDA